MAGQDAVLCRDVLRSRSLIPVISVLGVTLGDVSLRLRRRRYRRSGFAEPRHPPHAARREAGARAPTGHPGRRRGLRRHEPAAWGCPTCPAKMEAIFCGLAAPSSAI
ncbi:MAG: hypothetical protein M0C28_46925 [Candidatus Moduliflexus flocculans]|nr:hypothetical protein [Candidatus Moduliflexus flocculans]